MKITLRSSLKKLAVSAVLILSCSAILNADPLEKENKLSSIRDQVKKQLSIPASLTNKGLNEKASVSFIIEGEKIIFYKIETSNKKLKENLSKQFEKMKIKIEEQKSDGSYKIELSFKVL